MGALCALSAFFAPSAGRAEIVVGRVELPTPAAAKRDVLPPGYVRTRVTGAAEAQAGPIPFAVFLRATEDALPPKDPPEAPTLSLSGLRFSPTTAACADGGKVVLVNDDIEPVTFVVGGARLETVQPRESLTYECVIPTEGATTLEVGVLEWPGAHGAIYVGETGVPGVVAPDGSFRVSVSRGTYQLRVVGRSGVARELELEVNGRTVNVGTVELSGE